MKKIGTIIISLMVTGLLLTSCGFKKTYHHRTRHSRTSAEIEFNNSKKSSHHKKTKKINKKDMDKSGLSNNDIKKDSRAVKQKKSLQPVD